MKTLIGILFLQILISKEIFAQVNCLKDALFIISNRKEETHSTTLLRHNPLRHFKLPSILQQIKLGIPKEKIRVVYGMGNFDPNYFSTPHNLGLNAVDYVVESLPAKNLQYGFSSMNSSARLREELVDHFEFSNIYGFPEHYKQDFEFQFKTSLEHRTHDGEVYVYKHRDRYYLFVHFFGSYIESGEFIMHFKQFLELKAEQLLIVHDNAYATNRVNPISINQSNRGNVGIASLHKAIALTLLPHVQNRLSQLTGSLFANEITSKLFQKIMLLKEDGAIFDIDSFVKELRADMIQMILELFHVNFAQGGGYLREAFLDKNIRTQKIKAFFNSVPKHSKEQTKISPEQIESLVNVYEDLVELAHREFKIRKIQIGYHNELEQSGMRITDYILKKINIDEFLDANEIEKLKKLILNF